MGTAAVIMGLFRKGNLAILYLREKRPTHLVKAVRSDKELFMHRLNVGSEAL